MDIRRYRNGSHQVRGNARRPFRHVRRIQKIANSATVHSSLLPDHYFIWDPTEPVATRPLAWKRGTSVAYYTHDGNKNVSEVIASNNDVAAHYEYAPFGALTVPRGTSAAANPWRFSSEYAEDDTATVYYNYRHYEPLAGRWTSRDPIGEFDKGKSLIAFCCNYIFLFDWRGLDSECCCKVCLYSAVDLSTARKSGPVNVGEGMSGHTWINLESCSASDGEFGPNNSDNIFSFGPEPTGNSNKDLFWGVPGAYWKIDDYMDLNEYAVAKKCWSLKQEQCDKFREDLKDPYPDEFSLFDYCTNSAVDFLHDHGIDAPDGVGEIDMPWWFPNVDRANPKDMYDQIISDGGQDIGSEQGGF